MDARITKPQITYDASKFFRKIHWDFEPIDDFDHYEHFLDLFDESKSVPLRCTLPWEEEILQNQN